MLWSLCRKGAGKLTTFENSGIDKQHKAKRILPSSNLDLSDAFAVGGSVTAAAVSPVIAATVVETSPDQGLELLYRASRRSSACA